MGFKLPLSRSEMYRWRNRLPMRPRKGMPGYGVDGSRGKGGSSATSRQASGFLTRGQRQRLLAAIAGSKSAREVMGKTGLSWCALCGSMKGAAVGAAMRDLLRRQRAGYGARSKAEYHATEELFSDLPGHVRRDLAVAALLAIHPRAPPKPKAEEELDL